MAAESHGFKRLVLGFQPSAPDRAMRLAVELADLLQLDLLGLFLADTSVHDLAAIPFAREFRPLGGGWHAIDLDRLSHEMEVAARSSERIFSEAAKRLSTRWQFRIIRGPAAATIESVSRASDIVMVAEPASAAERATQQFCWLMEAAFRSAAAVAFAPRHIIRSTGPIVSIAAAPDDPSIHAAAAIAIAAKEELVIVDACGGVIDERWIRKLASDTGLTVRHLASDIPPSDQAFAAQALRHLQERLVVVSRGVLSNEGAMLMASSRRVPVLIVEPSPAAGSGAGTEQPSLNIVNRAARAQ